MGGRVRDELRSASKAPPRPADSDYVVAGVPLDDLIGRLRALGESISSGASFAVLKVTVDGQTVDVALPRRERSMGIGHRDFEVESGPGSRLEEDLGAARLSHEHDRAGAPDPASSSTRTAARPTSARAGSIF